MRNSTKFAVSLPCREFDDMEAVRKKAGLSRSAFILEALRAWKESRQQASLIRKYQEGYRLRPEGAALAEALARTSTDALGGEEWD
jgi:metal-responsive CopG/Arc/MetJ family transcriptional regulator